MKLTAVLLTTACLQISASGNSQTVTLDMKNVPVQQVFTEVIRQTGVSIVYNEALFKDAAPVTIKVKNAELTDVLQLCLKDMPLGFSMENNTVVVKQRSVWQSPDMLPPQREATKQVPPVEIKGRLVNEVNEPVAGASVRVKGTNIGTTTNDNGEFSLSGIDENATLVFSGTNIETFEAKVSSKPGLKSAGGLTLAAKTKVTSMTEVIVNKGYYTEKQKYSVGNVTKVTAKEIENQPVQNPLLALQGRVPGLVITQATGLPGSGVTARIQGQTSINFSVGNDPFYVIDGVPFPSRTYVTMSQIQGGSGPNVPPGPIGASNPLTYINPADIESIEILKDADATAIYGTRAANGAILITTKKGKAGRTRVDVNFQKGWGKVGKNIKLLNTEEYLEMRMEAISNAGQTITPTDANYDLNGTWEKSRYTDWQKVLIGGTANYTDVQASVSGGTANSQFLVSPGYHKETTVYPGDLGSTSGSLHFNLRNVSANQKFSIGLTGSYSINHTKLNNIDLTSHAITLAPNAPALYKPDGTLNWEQLPNGNATWANPLAYLNEEYSNKSNSLVANSEIGYQLSRSFLLKSSFGYSNLGTDQYILFPHSAVLPQRRITTDRASGYSSADINTWIIEPQLIFRKDIYRGKLESFIGTTIQQTKGSSTEVSGSGYRTDAEIKNINAAPVRSGGISVYKYKYNALFARLNYNWQDKYIFSANVRRDGSSRFGRENQFHNFGSLGIAWIFSNEKLVKSNFKWLSFGKVKGSYGTTGNDQIGDYRFLDLYQVVNVGAAPPFQNSTGYLPLNLPNPYLAWEENRKLNIGLDLGFLNDRIFLTANYSHNRSSNQLLGYSLPIITGFNSITQNFPAKVQNTTWEFTINSSIISTKNFSWNVGINLSIPNNKLLSFPNLAASTYADQLEIGQPLGFIKVYKFGGVNPATGLYQFIDRNGNFVSSPGNLDRTVYINTLPKYYGGFQQKLSYKEFELEALLQFVSQIARDYSRGSSSPAPGRFFGVNNTGNQPAYVLNRWLKPGDIADIQKVIANSSVTLPVINALSSDAAYNDASFVRVKNLAASWNVPNSWIQKLKLQSAKLFIHAQNLFTFTKYKGLDPETRSSTSLPPLRVITVGVKCSL